MHFRDEDKKTRERFWTMYVNFAHRFDWLMVLVCLASIVASLFYVKGIEIRSDFREMLPDKYQSVIELNKIDKRVKSSGNLAVLVGGDSWPQMRRFINDFVFRAKASMPADISTIDYNARDVHQFYDQNKYLYIDFPDLQDVYKRMKQQVDYEKIKQTPFFIEFDEEPPKFDITDIEDKYKEKTSSYQHYEDGYFTNENIDLAAILVKPREGSTDVTFAEHLISRLTDVISELDPASYDPSIKVAFGGRYKKMIEQYRALVGDILKSILLCVTLVGLILLAYYKRVRMVVWLTVVIMQGALITLAIARYEIGYLTSQTAFLGSIIVGNGINYGIIALSRFLEEKRSDKGLKDALVTALSTTWRATVTSSLTTSGAFVVLAFTKIKGFSQFGVIGCIGMVMCWITTYVFLPSFISLNERILPLNMKRISEKNIFSFFGIIGKWVSVHYKNIVKVSAAATILSIALMAWYLPRSLEYDFSELKFKSPEEGTGWEATAREQLNTIFGQSTTPSVVLTDSIEEVRPVCDAIKRKAEVDGITHIFDECKTIYDYVPQDQDEKLAVLADMRELLSGSTLSFLTEKQKREVEKFRDTFDLKRLELKDIPEEVATNFEEVDGKRGLIAYVYSKAASNLWDGKNLILFADLLREVKLPGGKVIHSSGEPAIFADLLQTVADEGPKITFLSLLVVVMIVIANFRKRDTYTIIVGTLLVGVTWIFGCLAIFNIKLNFLNFVALPISFGIGVDYSVNIYQRYRLEGRGSMPLVTRVTGAAVALCSSTTVIGYSVIMTSSSGALRSFGMVAIIGEFCCLIPALIAMPALIDWFDKRASTSKI